MISLKDYAKGQNISYEAVRKQVSRYKKELGDHIIREGKQQFLDSVAVSFLDEKRKKNPVVIQTINKDDRIQELEKEVNDLQKKMLLREAELQTEISNVNKELRKASEELRRNDRALMEHERIKLLADQRQELYDKEKKRADDLYLENQKLQLELSAERNKTFFQKLFRK